MDYTNLKERMEKSIGAFKEKLSEIRAGRANPAILNKVKIDAGVIFCISFTVVYLAGSILLIALWRQFYIIVPILIFWIFYIWNAMHKRNRGINVHS